MLFRSVNIRLGHHMPRRINVFDRIIAAIGVEVEAKRIICLTAVGVLLHEACDLRVVKPGVQVVQAALRVVHVARVPVRIREAARLLNDVPKRVLNKLFIPCPLYR